MIHRRWPQKYLGTSDKMMLGHSPIFTACPETGLRWFGESLCLVYGTSAKEKAQGMRRAVTNEI